MSIFSFTVNKCQADSNHIAKNMIYFHFHDGFLSIFTSLFTLFGWVLSNSFSSAFNPSTFIACVLSLKWKKNGFRRFSFAWSILFLHHHYLLDHEILKNTHHLELAMGNFSTAKLRCLLLFQTSEITNSLLFLDWYQINCLWLKLRCNSQWIIDTINVHIHVFH